MLNFYVNDLESLKITLIFIEGTFFIFRANNSWFMLKNSDVVILRCVSEFSRAVIYSNGVFTISGYDRWGTSIVPFLN